MVDAFQIMRCTCVEGTNSDVHGTVGFHWPLASSNIEKYLTLYKKLINNYLIDNI
jgi:hypothetical protein